MHLKVVCNPPLTKKKKKKNNTDCWIGSAAYFDFMIDRFYTVFLFNDPMQCF